MFLPKLIPTSLVVLSAAMVANAVGPGQHPHCEWAGNGRNDHGRVFDMHPSGGLNLAAKGFTITNVGPGVYDFYAGPTYNAYSFMAVNVHGSTEKEKTYRFVTKRYATCTAHIDRAAGQAMHAWFEAV